MLEKIQQMMTERNLKPADVVKGSGIPYTTLNLVMKIYAGWIILLPVPE